jgi:hypothetical protein
MGVKNGLSREVYRQRVSENRVTEHVVHTESTKDRHHLIDLGIDGRIILKYMLKDLASVDWINLTQDRKYYRLL